MEMTPNEDTHQINNLLESLTDDLAYLADRWEDEKGLEDLGEYHVYIESKLPFGFHLLHMSSVPFGFVFTYNSHTYMMFVDHISITWKRVA